MPILVFAKVFVNPDFSTSPVQAVLTRSLYLGTGTSLFGIPARAILTANEQTRDTKVRYNLVRL